MRNEATVAAVCYGRIPLLLRRGGRDIKKNGAPHQIMERTGWSLTNHVTECILEPWLASDHPVCGCFGGFAAFY
jgi:hypothetical protein